MKVKIIPIFTHHHFSIIDPASWLSLLIRIITNSYWNHCAFKFEEDYFFIIVESRSSGVTPATFENWIEHRPNKTWIYGIPQFVEKEEILKRYGKKYNVKSLFQQLLFQIYGIWIGSKSDTEENCSELLASILNVKDAYKATPASLYKEFGIFK